MLSTFPATNMSFDPFFSNPLPSFEGGFTSWAFDDFPPQDQNPVLSPDPSPVQEPFFSNSGSECNNSDQSPVLSPNPSPVISNSLSDSDNSNSNQNPANSNSGSDEPNRKRTISDSGLEDTNQEIDERKRRRMISNRESARRSRMRKQKHLENMRNQVNRLRVANRELMNRLRFVTHHCHVVQSDNERLRAESLVLRQRLWDIRQVLLVRQLQQQVSATSAWGYNNNNSVEQRYQSLITR